MYFCLSVQWHQQFGKIYITLYAICWDNSSSCNVGNSKTEMVRCVLSTSKSTVIFTGTLRVMSAKLLVIPNNKYIMYREIYPYGTMTGHLLTNSYPHSLLFIQSMRQWSHMSYHIIIDSDHSLSFSYSQDTEDTKIALPCCPLLMLDGIIGRGNYHILPVA